MEGLAGGRQPGDKHVEIELLDELEALDVGRTITRLEHRRDPFAFAQVDGVAGE
jgi:hypothetical protein